MNVVYFCLTYRLRISKILLEFIRQSGIFVRGLKKEISTGRIYLQHFVSSWGISL